MIPSHQLLVKMFAEIFERYIYLWCRCLRYCDHKNQDRKMNLFFFTEDCSVAT